MTGLSLLLITCSIVYILISFVLLIVGIVRTISYLVADIYYYPDDSDYFCFLVKVKNKEDCKIVIINNGYKISIKRMLIHSFLWFTPIFKSINNFFSLLQW